jgi:NAD(P)-dependent dehydrogenase (short-subunit alcohol dehydrogenase family)
MMVRLTPVAEQSVVITGASSGIGRVTALRFARGGARVTVAARNARALDQLVEQIEHEGGEALAVPTDVAVEAQVQALAERAAGRFGGIDTWVNNAGVSMYAPFDEVTSEEFRRVIDVNFFGQVYGCRAALPHLKQRGGGAIICVGSILSDRAAPLQSAYSASKHAVKGLTEALRVELQSSGHDIQVTLIKPSSINTPFFEHAKTRLGVMPKPFPPAYDPDLVAQAIVHAAEHPAREIVVGGAGKSLTAFEAFAGPLLDRLLAWTGDRAQESETAKSAEAANNLFDPSPGAGHERGRWGGRRFSVYTWARLHPRTTIAAGAASAVTAITAARLRGRASG